MAAREHADTAARRIPVALLLVAFATRIVIPAGFMPAAFGDGFPLRICPSGLSDTMMVALASVLPNQQTTDGHTHHGHGAADTDHDGSGDTPRFCPLGAGVLVLCSSPPPWIDTNPSDVLLAAVSNGETLLTGRFTLFDSRAPPSNRSRV